MKITLYHLLFTQKKCDLYIINNVYFTQKKCEYQLIWCERQLVWCANQFIWIDIRKHESFRSLINRGILIIFPLDFLYNII